MDSASRSAPPDGNTGQKTDEDVATGTVLVVDDEPHLVGMYAAMLDALHEVKTATSGRAALEILDADVDVVLLDRRMPELSGDELLEIIRSKDLDCRVAMVTSVDPGEAILDMSFDAYVVKPVRQDDLRELVENLLLRGQYSDGVKELMQVTSTLVALESRHDEEELAEDERYLALQERKEELETANEERHATLLDSGDTGLVYRDVLGSVMET